MKRINHKQVKSRGLKSVTIMCVYGSPAHIHRAKVELPFTVEREEAGGHMEPEESFIKRVENKHSDIKASVMACVKEPDLVEILNPGTWLKYNYLKPKVIHHNTVGNSKSNKKIRRYK